MKAGGKQSARRKPVRVANAPVAAFTLDDERELIEAAQHEHSRFAELYELNFHRLYAYVISRVRERAEAEDITAEVFHQALANLDSFEWRGVPFIGWLTRIAANAIVQRARRSARDQSDAAIPDEPVPDDVERRALLFELVDALPTDQRKVIIKRFVEDRSIREIAQEMGRTEGAIKQLQFRALVNLRDRMEGAYE